MWRNSVVGMCVCGGAVFLSVCRSLCAMYVPEKASRLRSLSMLFFETDTFMNLNLASLARLAGQ